LKGDEKKVVLSNRKRTTNKDIKINEFKVLTEREWASSRAQTKKEEKDEEEAAELLMKPDVKRAK
jgi:hypothetical protein